MVNFSKKNTEKFNYSEFPKYNVFAYSYHDIEWIPNSKLVKTVEEADIVVMPGGSDWTPALYNETVGKHTYSSSNIDMWQLETYIKAVCLGKFIIGICRGAQLLGIAMGGKLIQHVTNHAGKHHLLITKDNQPDLYTNSVHHQMVNWYSIPNINNRGLLFAWADSLSTTYLNGDNEQSKTLTGSVDLIKTAYAEPEIFFFRSINALGIQGHPEAFQMPTPTTEYILKKLQLCMKIYNGTVRSDEVVDEVIERMQTVFPALAPTVKEYLPKRIKKNKVEIFQTSLVTIKPTTNEENRNSNKQEFRIWG